MVTKMALLTQFPQTELSECRHRFFGHAEMLQFSLLLLEFAMKGRFSNIGLTLHFPPEVFGGGHPPRDSRLTEEQQCPQRRRTRS